MHPCPGNRVAIGRAVVYYTLAAHTFSAGIKCRHCSCGCMGGVLRRLLLPISLRSVTVNHLSIAGTIR